MASRIQGITVEIGGDTTKLTTALKSVNTDIRTTQPQLRDVERLLADAVRETKEKLETLKAAAERANEALAKGEITQERVYYLYREKKQPLLLAIDEALRQRITVHYNYEGLSDQEVPDYICHKLELAGGRRSILEGGAINAIHGYCEGNARKIDNQMTDALTIGTQQEQHCINAEIIMAAAND